MFTRLECERLQAMGLTVFETVPPVAVVPPVPLRSDIDGGFWQSRLGLNIRRHTEGLELSVLPVPVTGAEGKKSLWRKIRTLRNTR